MLSLKKSPFFLMMTVLLSVLTSEGLFAIPESFQKTGKLMFEKRYVDFGTVMRGSKLVYRFSFKNIGDGPVKILGVHASCGCTSVELTENKLYQPAEEGYIDVTLDTTSFDGPLTKVVSVMTTERARPDRTLTLKTKVMSELRVEPPLVDFGEVYSKEGSEQELLIKPVKGFDLEIKDLEYNSDLFDASMTRFNGVYKLSVALKKDVAAGFIKETIFIINNSKQLARLPVPVRAHVKGNIDHSPSYVEFGAIEKAASAVRTINLKGRSNFKINAVKSQININGRKIADGENFVKVVPDDKESTKQALAIELQNMTEQGGSVHGKLFLQTDDPIQNEIAIHFYAFFR